MADTSPHFLRATLWLALFSAPLSVHALDDPWGDESGGVATTDFAPPAEYWPTLAPETHAPPSRERHAYPAPGDKPLLTLLPEDAPPVHPPGWPLFTMHPPGVPTLDPDAWPPAPRPSAPLPPPRGHTHAPPAPVADAFAWPPAPRPSAPLPPPLGHTHAPPAPAFTAAPSTPPSVAPFQTTVVPFQTPVVPAQPNVVPFQTPVVPAQPNVVPFQTAVVPAQPSVAPAQPAAPAPMFLECERIGDALHCRPISVILTTSATPPALHPVAMIPDPLPTGRVDRDVAETLDAIHDPHQDAPDPETDITYGPVQRGDTVLEIAKRFFDASAINIFDAAAAIVRSNPHAFARGNPDHLLVATTLRIPDLEEARQLGTWASLIKQKPPTHLAESSNRTVPGTSPQAPILNVSPVPVATPQEIALETQAVHPGTRPPEANTLFAQTRPQGVAAHPRQAEPRSLYQELEELQRQIETIDQRLFPSHPFE